MATMRIFSDRELNRFIQKRTLQEAPSIESQEPISKQKFLKKYGNFSVTFASFHGYFFSFTGTLPDGSTLEVTIGTGEPRAISRVAVDSAPISVRRLDHYANITQAEIYRGDRTRQTLQSYTFPRPGLTGLTNM
jgi:hypothetical protein